MCNVVYGCGGIDEPDHESVRDAISLRQRIVNRAYTCDVNGIVALRYHAITHDPQEPVPLSQSTVSILGRSSTAADAGCRLGKNEMYVTVEIMVVNASMAASKGG